MYFVASYSSPYVQIVPALQGSPGRTAALGQPSGHTLGSHGAHTHANSRSSMGTIAPFGGVRSQHSQWPAGYSQSLALGWGLRCPQLPVAAALVPGQRVFEDSVAGRRATLVG